MLYAENHRGKFIFIAVSFFIFSFSPVLSFSQIMETDAILVLKGNTRLRSGKGDSHVDLELKKDEHSIKKILSGKNGKYTLEMNISILNKNSEYILYISQTGMISKSIIINTYISPDEYSANIFPTYVFDLEIELLEKKANDIVVSGPLGKITWDYKQHAFTFDQSFAKIIHESEDDPNKYLAEKKRKHELELAGKKAELEARLKQAEEAALLAKNQLKNNTAKSDKEKIAAIAMLKKHIQDSLDNIRKVNIAKQKLNIKESIKPILSQDTGTNVYDVAAIYSMSSEEKSLRTLHAKAKKEKAENLSAKYETNNVLTSLLNMIDEDARNRKK